MKYNVGAVVSNSLIGSGSILNGEITDSVVFRKVFADEGSVIRNSIIMEDSYIGKGCVVENAIIDKDVYISDGRNAIGKPGEPMVLKKGARL